MPCLNKKLVLASRNKKKIGELQKILDSCGLQLELLSLDDIGYTEEIEENGKTFEENSFIKASVPASLGYIGIADDSGLCVDYLNGEPGIYSARYAGTGKDTDNIEKLLSALEGVPTAQRGAKFVCVITCVFPDGEKIVCRGEVHGYITDKPSGEGGFGYDPVFFYEPDNCTFAELGSEKKNKISHRANALEKFSQELKKLK